MAIATISETIERGQLSISYAGNDNSKGSLFSPRIASPGSMVTIAMITDALNWGNAGGGQTVQNVRAMANYLIWLIGFYGQQAQARIDGNGGGGSVIPGGGTTLAFALDWRVSGTATAIAPFATGDTAVTFDGTGIFPDLRGYNIDYYRGGIVQYTTDPGDGSTYYSWSRSTGVLTLFGAAPANGAAQLDEPMRITPIG